MAVNVQQFHWVIRVSSVAIRLALVVELLAMLQLGYHTENGKNFGVDLGKSTVHAILKESKKWMSVPTASSSSCWQRPPKFEKLEEAVNIWFAEMRSRGAAEMLQEKLAEFLAQYSPDDIYNFDETGFFYKLGPSSTLASEPVAGNKRSKERITVGFLCNASGTHKWKPIVVAKAERPRCFGKTFDPNMYCSYNCNKKVDDDSNMAAVYKIFFDEDLEYRVNPRAQMYRAGSERQMPEKCKQVIAEKTG
ncbi:uncharacterized protein LOC121837369 [Ixodes scapularis]|uniref:uncharacterized protein LOC121837369 n=1 Tax=Ixodes scapularis TaxID=6945 RepID=UPI001C391FA9|nr:uncharacterized protein LOC121837369 [Ixodes scapularis]